MTKGLDQQKKAVECGHWPLCRCSPLLEEEGKNPLIIDSKEPTITFADYALNENRYRMLKMANPTQCDALMDAAQKDVDKGWKFLQSRFKSFEQA
jgi:pyruvate-ferredoxin/flavodoxin oxidoreductase